MKKIKKWMLLLISVISISLLAGCGSEEMWTELGDIVFSEEGSYEYESIDGADSDFVYEDGYDDNSEDALSGDVADGTQDELTGDAEDGSEDKLADTADEKQSDLLSGEGTAASLDAENSDNQQNAADAKENSGETLTDTAGEDKTDATVTTDNDSGERKIPGVVLDETKSYNSKEDVAAYIYIFGHLPSNYITKKEAEKLGWSGGSLESYAPGKSIGGSKFGNYEGLLPEKQGRVYFECDIDTAGKNSRGAKRIVYSSDGLIYYTEDHYETFTLLYGQE